MGFKNFVPRFWNAEINRELERLMVFAEDCNRQYEGEVKQAGDSIKILGVGKPNITSSTTSDRLVAPGRETVSDSSTTLIIKQTAAFNYTVDDIDKRQSIGNIMSALSAETSEGLGDAVDVYIASFAKARDAIKDTANGTVITKDNILSIIDNAQAKLFEKDVKLQTDTVLTVSPWVYMLLRQAYTRLDTDNSAMIKNGFVGMYGNIKVKMSNNVATEAGKYYMMLRTKRAVAFVKPMTHTEAYRPENEFSDAIKGFILFDAKIVRPKEMIVIVGKKA